MGQILRKRLTMRGFIILQDFGYLYPEFAKAMRDWLAAGKIQGREEMIEGLKQLYRPLSTSYATKTSASG